MCIRDRYGAAGTSSSGSGRNRARSSSSIVVNPAPPTMCAASRTAATGRSGSTTTNGMPDLPVVAVLEAAHMVGGAGFTTMEADDLARFRPLPELDVPAAPYLLLDVDTGPDTLNVPPSEALPRITAAGRSPLTVAEGLSVLAAEPGVLRTRSCFSLLGSRAGDKRVPALWVSARRPRLGWCYQGAPHTWLGSASCAGRLAEPARIG